MGRRKKGRAVSGWLVLDKPYELGSTPAVARVRRLFDASKAGHAGTLDPLATGLLPIALGEATKTVPYVTDGEKAYRFAVRWGVSTTTDDREGEVVAESDQRPPRDAIEALLPDFTGAIEQTPPAFSAIKIDGKRAYAEARAGRDVVLEPRTVHIESLSIESIAGRRPHCLRSRLRQGHLCARAGPRYGRTPRLPRPCHRPAPHFRRTL